MAALLTIGSALLLVSCGGDKGSDEEAVSETLMTQRAEELIIIESKQGGKKNRFATPLVEGYDYAKEPYKEFRKGVNIETYADSTEMIESTLVADYAIFFEKRELWEAKGNVVVTNAQGHILETQQLFWNQRTAKIYSNIDCKITQGDDIILGVGFESDETFKDWEFRRPRGKVTVEVDPQESDATSDSSVPVGNAPAIPAGGSVANIATPDLHTPKPPTANTSRITDSEVAPIDPEVIARERRERMEKKERTRPSRGESTDDTVIPRGLKP